MKKTLTEPEQVIKLLKTILSWPDSADHHSSTDAVRGVPGAMKTEFTLTYYTTCPYRLSDDVPSGTRDDAGKIVCFNGKATVVGIDPDGAGAIVLVEHRGEYKPWTYQGCPDCE